MCAWAARTPFIKLKEKILLFLTCGKFLQTWHSTAHTSPPFCRDLSLSDLHFPVPPLAIATPTISSCILLSNLFESVRWFSVQVSNYVPFSFFLLTITCLNNTNGKNKHLIKYITPRVAQWSRWDSGRQPSTSCQAGCRAASSHSFWYKQFGLHIDLNRLLLGQDASRNFQVERPDQLLGTTAKYPRQGHLPIHPGHRGFAHSWSLRFKVFQELSTLLGSDSASERWDWSPELIKVLVRTSEF